MRILVVDDDAAVRDSLVRTLRFQGYDNDAAADDYLANRSPCRNCRPG